MATTVTMTKISDHKRGQSGRQGVSMYTFVYGEGKNKKSQTKHMTANEAEAHKNSLGGK